MVKKILFVMFLSLCFAQLSCAEEGEEITLTTYYPAPYGEYNELSTNVLESGYVDLDNATYQESNPANMPADRPGRMIYDKNDGDIKYYDGINNQWKGALSGGIQKAYDSGWFTTLSGTLTGTYESGSTFVIMLGSAVEQFLPSYGGNEPDFVVVKYTPNPADSTQPVVLQMNPSDTFAGYNSKTDVIYYPQSKEISFVIGNHTGPYLSPYQANVSGYLRVILYNID